MNLTEIKVKPISELVDIAKDLGLEDVGRAPLPLRKDPSFVQLRNVLGELQVFENIKIRLKHG